METLRSLFGDWLPDLPDLDNPGLIEANNVFPSDGGYKPFRPMSAIATAIPATNAALATTIASTFYPHAAIMVSEVAGGATELFVVGGRSGIWQASMPAFSGTVSAWTQVAAGPTEISDAAFGQFDDLIVGTYHSIDEVPIVMTIGASSFTALATSGTAPAGAWVVAQVGRFLVFGNLVSTAEGTRPSTLQWSAIDEPRNWPTPGSSTATATQAGEQVLELALGEITGIYGTDQYGIILQTGGITRMQYIGGTVVFQFDKVEHNIGSSFRYGAIMVGGIVYFASHTGFYSTNGVQVVPIGDGKVDQYFIKNYNQSGVVGGRLVQCGYDRINDVIYWAYGDIDVHFGSTSPNRTNKLLMYHRATGRWSRGEQTQALLLTPQPSTDTSIGLATITSSVDVSPDLYGFDTSRRLCRFKGTPETATLITREIEAAPGRYSHLSGIKPLIEYTSTAPAVNVSIGSRNDQGDGSLAFTGTTTATTDTGFHDFRDSARYHRVKVQITGEFEKATGLEYMVTPEGRR